MHYQQANQTKKTGTIPIGAIWTFWDGNPPDLVLRCVESMRLQNPERPLIVVSKATLSLFLSPDDYPMFHGCRGGPDDFSCPQYLADWVRLTLLEKYGGVWLDASIICTNAVESWCTTTTSDDFGANKITMFPMHANSKIHGNWAMAVDKPGHPLLCAWRRELCQVFNETGTGQVPMAYCEQVFVEHPNLVELWHVPSPPPLPYLWVYLALQVVLQKEPQLHACVRLLPSIDGPMFRRYKLNIQQGIVDSHDLSEATANDLANLPLCLGQHDRYFIKLVGKDRGPCETMLEAGTFQTHSPLDYLSSLTPRSIEYGTNLQTAVLVHSLQSRNTTNNNRKFHSASNVFVASRFLDKLDNGNTSFLQQRDLFLGAIPRIARTHPDYQRRSSWAVSA